jgi:hypothetical protein
LPSADYMMDLALRWQGKQFNFEVWSHCAALE